VRDYRERLKKVIPACEDVPQARGKVAEFLVAIDGNGKLMPPGSKYDVLTEDGRKREVKGGTSSPNRHTGASAEWDILTFVRTDIFGHPELVAEIPRERLVLAHAPAIQTHRDTVKNGVSLIKEFANPAMLKRLQQIYAEAL
jgi:hypothetical protein